MELGYRFYDGRAFSRIGPHFQNDRCFPFTVFVYVGEGAYYCTAKGTELVIKPGETLVVPPHIYHSISMKEHGTLHWAHISLTADETDLPFGRTAPYRVEGGYSERIGWCLKKLNGLRDYPGELQRTLLKDRYIAEIFDIVMTVTESSSVPESGLDFICSLIRRKPGDRYTLGTLAQLAGMSPRSFGNKFREDFGITPMQYVSECRVKLAAFLLASGNSVKEVSLRTGYYDPYHFSKQFKTAMGVSPSEYAKTHSLEI